MVQPNLHRALCDGLGSCIQADVSCCSYKCDTAAVPDACKTTCSGDADCVAPATCDGTLHCTGGGFFVPCPGDIGQGAL